MTEFIEVKSKNAARAERMERAEQSGTRQPTVKRMCAFLAEAGDSTKVGGMIKNDIPAIRKEAGGPCFISYKSESDAQPEVLAEWLSKFSELAIMESQGAGWYIWSFRAEVTLKVKGDLQAASEKRDAKSRSYQRRFDRTPVLVTDTTSVRARVQQSVPSDSEFLVVIGSRARPLHGGQKGGKTQESSGSKKGRVIRVDGPMPEVGRTGPTPLPAAPKKDAFDDDE